MHIELTSRELLIVQVAVTEWLIKNSSAMQEGKALAVNSDQLLHRLASADKLIAFVKPDFID